MPAELVDPGEGETPPAAGAPGPEVTPEGGEPAPQPAAGVEELTQDGLEAALQKASSGQFGANDADMFRRHYSKADARVKAVEAELAAAKGANPLGDLAEKLILQECGTDAALAEEHRKWIAEAPGGVADYIEALRGRKAEGDAAGEQPEESEEQRIARVVQDQVKAALAPERERQEKARISTQFTASLDAALKGMKIGPEIAAHVREGVMRDMEAWLNTGIANFGTFVGVDPKSNMADLLQARATKLQKLFDAVQAGKGAPTPPLPEATPVPTADQPPAETKDKSIDEMFDDLGKKYEAKLHSGRGAS